MDRIRFALPFGRQGAGRTPNSSALCGLYGERGRNRTYNLLIKSQLLCQLSYAPIANGNVGTNVNYTIRLVRSWRAVERGSYYFARRDLIFGLCSRRSRCRSIRLESNRPGASARDRKLSSCISRCNFTGSARAGAYRKTPPPRFPPHEPRPQMQQISKLARLEPFREVAGITKIGFAAGSSSGARSVSRLTLRRLLGFARRRQASNSTPVSESAEPQPEPARGARSFR